MKKILLTADFFTRATVTVAREPVGAVLRIRGSDGLWSAGRVVETEAYEGEEDPASHAGRGRTPRSEIMYGPAGLAYVYLIYGMHHCLNVVTEAKGTPGAVLIRALEPVSGQSVMARRRGLDLSNYRQRDLTSGPGKLCQAMDIDLSWNGLAIASPQTPEPATGPRLLVIEAATTPVASEATPRIGISQATDRLHRFTDPTSRFLSR